MTTREPGIYHDLPIDEYHGGDGLSNTGLQDLARSPFRYWATHLNPRRPKDEETPSRLHGHLAHCAICEPNEFDRRYVVIPADAPRRPTLLQLEAKSPSTKTLDAIDWWDQFTTKHKDKTIITPEQRDTARAQRASVLQIPDAAGMLANSRAEVSAYHRDPATGILLRVRPDVVHDVDAQRVILIDVKTYNRADVAEFSKQIQRMRYDWQESFYRHVYAAASGREVVAFLFLAVEDSYPYEAQLHQIDDEGLDETMAEWRPLLNIYAECMKTGVWPRATAVNLLKRPRRFIV